MADALPAATRPALPWEQREGATAPQASGRSLQYRLAPVDPGAIDAEGRRVRVAVSSETPVHRWFGQEILDHGPGAVRTQRLNLGAPVLHQHRMGEQVGVLEQWEIGSDRVLRAWLRFGRSRLAEEIWADIADGIRRNISVGYLIHRARAESKGPDAGKDDDEVFRIVDWEPVEVSTVSAGADPTVGVGRAFEAPVGDRQMPEVIETTEGGRGAGGAAAGAAATQAPQAQAVARDGIAAAVDAERARTSEIAALGRRYGQREAADQAVSEGQSLDAFRALLLERLGAGNLPAGDPPPPARARAPQVSAAAIGVSSGEVRQYRLMRAINAAATGDWRAAGFEREVSLAIAETVGREARGFYVPHEALLSRRDVEKAANLGAELVATEVMAEAFIDVMRNRALIGQLGAVILPGLIGDMDIPRKTAGAGFYWLDEKDDVTLDDLALDTVALTPKTVAGALPVTRRMRKQSSLAVEQLLRDDLVAGIAVEIDEKVIAGDGTGNTPTGIVNATGVSAEEYPIGGMDWASLVLMETDTRTANIVGPGSFAYLTTPGGLGEAKTAEKATGTAQFLMAGGQINGYRAEDSMNVPADSWIFGDFSQVFIGMWGVVDVQVDVAALAARDGLVVRVFQDMDCALRLPAAFTVATRAAS
jgi:HK97 family phage major capsid protein